jgi:WS/DGAT/MGAT family acyltransferase
VGGGLVEQLNSLDAAFVDAEDQDKNASFAIASVSVFEGPAPSYEEFLEATARRLPLVPLYRRRLRKVPFGLGPPVWVDDPNFDLRYHVRQTALPSPGGDQQLRRLMARVMAERLDRDYPLWEFWLVEGVDHGRWALITKVHHAMVDGISATDLYRVIFDTSPEPPPLPAVPDRSARPEPSGLALAARAAANAALMPVREEAAIRRSLADPELAVRKAAETVRGLARYARALQPAAASSLSGRIGRQRRYTWARASLDDVKTIKNELGGTVNDIFLAAISSAFRDLLLSRWEEPAPTMVRSLVPVSVRSPGEESVYDNRLSALVADLPVDISDPAERLAAVVTQMAMLKASSEAEAGEAFVSLRRFAPFVLASMFVRLVFSIPQREIVTVTTNIPGPQFPLYALGRRLVEIIPYVPIATTLRTGVSIFTYSGQVTFGITGDYATTPDLDVLATGIEDGIADLLKVVGQRRGKRPAGQGKSPKAAKSAGSKPAAAKGQGAKEQGVQGQGAQGRGAQGQGAQRQTARRRAAKPTAARRRAAKPTAARPEAVGSA